MATHSSTLAWKIPWMEEPGRLQSMGSLRVRHNWVTSLFTFFTFHFHALEKEMATDSSVLAWRIPGTGEPGGLPSLGSHRVGHDWSDLAAVAVAYSLISKKEVSNHILCSNKHSILKIKNYCDIFSKGRSLSNPEKSIYFQNLYYYYYFRKMISSDCSPVLSFS